ASSGNIPYSREITQATPKHSPKAHIYLDPERTASITIPLSEFRRLELEFYKFGGTASMADLNRGIRTPGCPKRLTVIQPPDNAVITLQIFRDDLRLETDRECFGFVSALSSWSCFPLHKRGKDLNRFANSSCRWNGPQGQGLRLVSHRSSVPIRDD